MAAAARDSNAPLLTLGSSEGLCTISAARPQALATGTDAKHVPHGGAARDSSFQGLPDAAQTPQHRALSKDSSGFLRGEQQPLPETAVALPLRPGTITACPPGFLLV